MRKIQYKRYIGDAVGTDSLWVIGEGYFHEWGFTVEEFSNGAVSASVAIFEDENGKVWMTLPSNIKFLTPYKPVTDESSTHKSIDS